MTATTPGSAAPRRDSPVTLREITAETLRPVLKLKVAPHQEGFVAPNATSIAEAHFSTRAWFRAIYAGETPIGFVMLEEPDPKAPADSDEAQPFLWRLMIGAEHQRQGFGRRALDLVLDDVRARPGTSALLTSCVPGDGSPCGFYRALGFVETGAVEDGEIVMRLALTAADRRPQADSVHSGGIAMSSEELPAPDDVKAVGRGLAAFNRQHAPEDDYRLLALFLRDGTGAIVGGLVGETFWDWLHVELLWVREDLRGQGHGGRLLAAAEEEAIRRRCRHAFVDTLSFQAPTFYARRGYRVFGGLPDFPAGHTRLYLSKQLSPEATDAPR